MEQCLGECLWNGPWDSLTSLSCDKRQFCTHVNWVYQATVLFSASPESLEVLAVLFLSPFIQSSRHPLLQENEDWGDDPGMWYISVPVSCHVARQNMVMELLQAPWVPSDRRKWCEGIPLFVPPQMVRGFLRFWTYDLHHHHSVLLRIILSYSDSFL